MAWLRFTKASVPLKQGENYVLPSSPGVKGVIRRMDGMERKNRTLLQSRRPKSHEDGSLALPSLRWDKDSMTAARLASIAHTWALAKMAESDPKGHKEREGAIARARVIPILGILFCVMMIVVGKINIPVALGLLLAAWALMIAVSIPSQFREWKAIAIAKKGLRDAGLYPQFQDAASVLDRCITACSWSRVAGFRQIVPK